MRVKNVQQQAQLTLHRMRQGFIEQRTATITRIRGLLSEFGVVLPLKAATVRREAALHLEDLPGWANLANGDGLSELHRLDERIEQYDRHLSQVARQDARAAAEQVREFVLRVARLELPNIASMGRASDMLDDARVRLLNASRPPKAVHEAETA